MPGEEVLLGLGLLANAMQFVTFARDALQVYKHIRDGQAPDPQLEDYTKDAKTCYESIRDVLESDGQRTDPPLSESEQKKLLELSKKCEDRLEKLSTSLGELSVPRDRQGVRASLSRLRNSVKVLFNPKEIEGLEKDLARYEDLVRSQLLARICSQTRAMQLKTSSDFDRFDKKIQNIIEQSAAGYTAISDLVRDINQENRNHMTVVAERTKDNIISNIIGANIQVVEKAQREHATQDQQNRLLQSLWYPELNDRWNRIEDTAPETFRWILYEPNDTTHSESRDGTDSEPAHLPGAASETADPDKYIRLMRNGSSQDGFSSFVGWLKAEDQIFWINGKPASGKSTLMKYILSHDKTLQYLKCWRAEVQIISHYFWKPGSEMQRSIKGMLCSLLWQLLRDNLPAVYSMMERHPAAKMKTSHSDWSVNELLRQLEATLIAANSATFIGLDGLDEAVINDVETTNILGVLDKIRSIGNVKVCVSSRPSPLFDRNFNQYPNIRVSDLTYMDIQRVIDQRLPRGAPLPSKRRDDFIWKIASRAQGVFLWALLVVASLKRGIQNGDSSDKLAYRLDTIPGDLELLFKDMWKRLGDDSKCYQEEAALYMRLHMLIMIMHSETKLPVFSIASDRRMIDEIVDKGRGVEFDEINRLCDRTRSRISVACAGLLEASPPRNGCWPADDEPRINSEQSYKSYAKSRVVYIHRTAYDFITDTNAGKEILDSIDISDDELHSRLALSCMIIGRLKMERGDVLKEYVDRRIHFATIYRQSIRTAQVQERCEHTLWQWQMQGLFDASNRWRPPYRPATWPSTNFLRLEYFEIEKRYHGVDEAKWLSYLQCLQDKEFLEMVPIIAQGSDFSYVRQRESPHSIFGVSTEWHRVVQYILQRLGRMTNCAEGSPGSRQVTDLDGCQRPLWQMMIGNLFQKLFFTFGILDRDHRSWRKDARDQIVETLELILRLGNATPEIWSRRSVLMLRMTSKFVSSFASIGFIMMREEHGMYAMDSSVISGWRGDWRMTVTCRHVTAANWWLKRLGIDDRVSHGIINERDTMPWEVILVSPVGPDRVHVTPKDKDRARLSALTEELLGVAVEENVKEDARRWDQIVVTIRESLEAVYGVVARRGLENSEGEDEYCGKYLGCPRHPSSPCSHNVPCPKEYVGEDDCNSRGDQEDADMEAVDDNEFRDYIDLFRKCQL